MASQPQDGKEFIRKCMKYQLFTPVPHCPPKELTSTRSLSPFTQWGVDIVGPLPPSKGGVKFVVVVVYYFTKWVEA